MAIIAGNFDLAEIIKVHKASDVGELVSRNQFVVLIVYCFIV